MNYRIAVLKHSNHGCIYCCRVELCIAIYYIPSTSFMSCHSIIWTVLQLLDLGYTNWICELLSVSKCVCCNMRTPSPIGVIKNSWIFIILPVLHQFLFVKKKISVLFEIIPNIFCSVTKYWIVLVSGTFGWFFSKSSLKFWHNIWTEFHLKYVFKWIF